MSPAQVKVLITGKLLLWQKEVFNGSLPRKGNSRFGELITMIAGVCREYKIRAEDMGKVLTDLAHESSRREKSS